MNFSDLQSVPTRDRLAELAEGVAVELGVARGDYSFKLLSNERINSLYSVDRWGDHHDEAEMRCARERLGVFGDRSKILRAEFSEAVGDFSDGFFDLIYIDGYAHTGQDGGRTLNEWWPKLKNGGIFAGHDYCRRYVPTMAAVDRFLGARGLPLHVTSEADFPSWMTVKP